MKFECTDELQNFSFEDCIIKRFEATDSTVSFEVEALIVKPSNSQNPNYTESYAGTALIRLIGGRLLSGRKEGFRYYDADDRLISVTPDEELGPEQLREFPSRCKDAYLFRLEESPAGEGRVLLDISIEFPAEEEYASPNDSDSYALTASCEKVIIGWDQYLNRVQR